MPFVWIGISALSGILTGIIYEKETDKSVVLESSTPRFNWWDKLLMAGAGIAAYYIYRSSK